MDMEVKEVREVKEAPQPQVASLCHGDEKEVRRSYFRR